MNPEDEEIEEAPYIPDYVLLALAAVRESGTVNMITDRHGVINALINSDIDAADDAADWCRAYPEEYLEGLRQMAELISYER